MLFEAGQTYPAGTHARSIPPTRIESGRSYWVYVVAPQENVNAAQLKPPALDPQKHPFGELFEPTAPQKLKTLAFAKAFWWHSEAQQAMAVRPDETLIVGRVYWVVRSQPSWTPNLAPRANEKNQVSPSTPLEPHRSRHDDRVAPLLYIEPEPPEAFRTDSFFSVRGMVFDENEPELSINGVVVANSSQNFAHQLWLPKEGGTIRLVVQDSAGNVHETRRQVAGPRTPTGLGATGTPAEENAALGTSALIDDSNPILHLDAPEHSVSYSNEPLLVLRGQVHDEHLRFLSINGLVARTTTGTFATPVRLMDESTVFTVAARDWSGRTTETTRTIIYDPDPPTLTLKHPREALVYTKNYTVEGNVYDPFLKQLLLIKTGSGEEETLKLRNGHFQSPLRLDVGSNQFELFATDRAGNATSIPLVFVVDDTPYNPTQSTWAPSHLEATAQDGTAHLRWAPPTRLVDGSPIPRGVAPGFRVYRNDELVAQVTVPSYTEQIPDAEPSYTYYVTAVLHSTEGNDPESSRSSVVDLGRKAPLSPPGAFEAAYDVVQETEPTRVPEVAFATSGNTTYTHLVYLTHEARDGSGKLRYLRSTAFGAAESWSTPVTLARAAPPWTIVHAKAAAHGDTLVVGWIETAKDGTSRVRVTQSTKAGQPGTFSHVRDFRENQTWKRSLGMALDAHGQHHMIWNEAGKVFYVKNFQEETDVHGQWVNVFDERKRWVNHERVVYAQLTEASNCTDPCCTEEHRDSYSLGHEIDPRSQKPLGPYLERVEETYVEFPSLYVDDDKVTIVARQNRMFDNFPYRNPDWLGHTSSFLGPPVSPPAGQTAEGPDGLCPPFGAIRHQMGFQVAQAQDPYACPLDLPNNVETLIRADSNRAGTTRWSRQDFYAYDALRGHEASWYQRRFTGQWFEDDHLKVAQRPLREEDWSRPRPLVRAVPTIENATLVFTDVNEAVEEGWKRGSWQRSPFKKEPVPHGTLQFEESFQNWRISTVESFPCEQAGDYARCKKPSNTPVGPIGPSYPNVYTAPDGVMYAVYEKGDNEDPNQPGHNPIYLASSHDGGTQWTVSEAPIALGYMPKIGVAARGEIAVVYYQPGGAHHSAADDRAANKDTTPSEKKTAQHELRAGRIMVARSTDGLTFSHALLSQRWDRVLGASVPVQAHPIHPRVYGRKADLQHGVPTLATHEDLWFAAWVGAPQTTHESPRIVAARASAPSTPKKSIQAKAPGQATRGDSFKVTVSCVDQYNALTSGCLAKGTTLAGGGGPPRDLAALVKADTYTLHGRQDLWFSPGPQAALAVSEVSNERTILLQPKKTDEKNVHANHRRAQNLRDALYVPGVQVEYLEVKGDRDSKFLALFDRAWTYTQGIALAQYARHQDPRAEELANTLCQNAVTSPDGSTIMGWPFSQNTEKDTWRDARLVTGANAWAVHGLGVFVVSDPFRRLPGASQKTYASCYARALLGLRSHRRSITSPPGKQRWLMTAGTTAAGLQHAGTPHKIGLTADEALEYDYYDVLDIIGYDEFRPDLKPKITTFYRDALGEPNLDEANIRTLTERDRDVFDRLQAPAIAQNVVTEHNLDTLSVLNHARKHWGDIVPLLPETLRAELGTQSELTAWRDGLREALFTTLWREKEGRVITGGEFNTQGEFVANERSAIDNCSWLALSVSYADLSKTEQKRLARCLHYTIDHFVRSDLELGGAYYRGAFYFPGSFKDPYVEASQDNERLYHLEATTGLILGLSQFVNALKADFPKDAARFEEEAAALWTSMQDFVADNGMPYSSIRIHNLMTELPSSTAAIWFIDVYDHFAGKKDDLDRPLRHYASSQTQPEKQWTWTENAELIRTTWNRLSAKSDLFAPGARRIVSRSIEVDLGVTGVTFLEDQALAILAALAHGEDDMATAWVEGLLKTVHVVEEDGTRYAQFPYAVYTKSGQALAPYYQTGSQMLALYALGAYLKPPRGQSEGSPSVSGATQDRARDTFGAVLGTLLAFYHGQDQAWFKSGGGDAEALALALANPLERPQDSDPSLESMQPFFEQGALTDQVYAYFALDMALTTHESTAPLGNDSKDHLIRIRSDVISALEHAFNIQERPVPYVQADPPPGGWEDRLDAQTLTVLYGLARGNPGVAERAWERLVSLTATDQVWATPAHPHFGASPVGVFLARRAMSALDPRLEELALLDFKNLAQASTHPRDQAGLILALDPKGLLGVESGSLLGQNAPQLQALTFEGGPYQGAYEAILDARLQDAYFDALFVLLAAPFRPHRFDTQLRRLTHVEFAAWAIKAGHPPQTWVPAYPAEFRVHLLRTVNRLKDPCKNGFPNLNAAPSKDDAISYALGLSCQDIGAQFERLLKTRVGSLRGEDLTRIIERPNDELELLDFVGQIHALGAAEGVYEANQASIRQSMLFGNLGRGPVKTMHLKQRSTALFTQYGALGEPPVLVFPEHASTQHVSTALQSRLAEILVDATRQKRQEGQQVLYDVSGMDFISMANEGSSEHWGRQAAEYAALRDIAPNLQTTLVGRSVNFEALASTPHLQRPEQMQNIRQLRRFLNLEAKGSLPAAAEAADLSADDLHRLMRTGHLRERDFLELARGLDLHRDTIETWRPLFAFFPPEAPQKATEAPPIAPSLFDLHRQAPSADRFLAQTATAPLPEELTAWSEGMDAVLHVLGASVVIPPEGAQRCYEVYRFNILDLDDGVAAHDDISLIPQQMAEAHLLEPCFDGQGPFIDTNLLTPYVELFSEQREFFPAYVVRKAWVPWPEGAMAGGLTVPGLPGVSEFLTALPLTGRRVELDAWVGQDQSPEELGQPELGVFIDEAEVRIEFQEPLVDCHRVIKVPTRQLPFFELLFASEAYLESRAQPDCFEGSVYTDTLSTVERQNHPWTYAFVSETHNFGRWPELLAAGKVILASTKTEPSTPQLEPIAELDVALFLTERAIQAAVDRSGLEPGEILEIIGDAAISELNYSFTKSHIPVHANLAHVGTTSLKEGPYIDVVGEEVDTNPPEDIREAYEASEADVVSVLVHDSVRLENRDKSDAGSVGYSRALSWSHTPVFHIANWDTLFEPTHTFAHELGHNLGCLHEKMPESRFQPLFPYARAFKGPSLSGFRTHGTLVSAYSPDSGQIFSLFANPNLFYRGIQIGDPEQADCSRTIRETAPLISTINGTVPWWGTPPRRDGLELLDLAGTPVDGEQQSALFEARSLDAPATTYILRNTIDVPVPWKLTQTLTEGLDGGPITFQNIDNPDHWVVDVSPREGMLAPGETTRVTFRLNRDRAQALEPKFHGYLVVFNSPGSLAGMPYGGATVALGTPMTTSPSSTPEPIPTSVRLFLSAWPNQGATAPDALAFVLRRMFELEILVPNAEHSQETPTNVPSWTKTMVEAWVNNVITDKEFLAALQFLIYADILRIPPKPLSPSTDTVQPKNPNLGENTTSGPSHTEATTQVLPMPLSRHLGLGWPADTTDPGAFSPIALLVDQRPFFRWASTCDPSLGASETIRGSDSCMVANVLPGFDPDTMPFSARLDLSLPGLPKTSAQAEIDNLIHTDDRLTFTAKIKLCDPSSKDCTAPAVDRNLLFQELTRWAALDAWQTLSNPTLRQEHPTFEQGSQYSTYLTYAMMAFLAANQVSSLLMFGYSFEGRLLLTLSPWLVGSITYAVLRRRTDALKGMPGYFALIAVSAAVINLSAIGYVGTQLGQRDSPIIEIDPGDDKLISLSVSMPTNIASYADQLIDAPWLKDTPLVVFSNAALPRLDP